MIEKFDAIVVGLGAVGSAALYQLSLLNLKVLGIDQFHPPHNMGSSHGDTRITRQAIGEGSVYTPLALRSHKIWSDIEHKLGVDDLFTKTGLLVISSPEKSVNVHVEDFFETTVKAARDFQIEHELLNAQEMKERFPQFLVNDTESGYYEPEAGFLRPEKCIAANLKLAKENGATIVFDSKINNIKESIDTGITIKADASTYMADKLLITAGAWIKSLIPELKHLFKVHRQVLYWFDVANEYNQYKPDKCPVYIWEPQTAEHGIYGFPAIDGKDGGIKIAAEIYDQEIERPEDLNRDVSQEETVSTFNQCIKPFFKGIDSRCLKAAVCMYTSTSDCGFVIDKAPGKENIWFASPCSGHGFKHSAALGEALAQLLNTGQSKIDLSTFKSSRFH